jgi:hypothetical protein
MARRAKVIVILLVLACAGGLADRVVGEDESAEPLMLSDVLARDPRESPAACANVAYGTAGMENTAATSVPNPAGPTRVDVSLFVLAIDQIDASSNSFRFEGYGGLIWCDPRRAFESAASGEELLRIEGEEARRRLGGMWWPGLFLPTQFGRPELTLQQLLIFSDGTIQFSTKINSRLMARYDFRRFPLDTQTLAIVLQAGRLDAGDLRIGEAPGQVGLDRNFEVPEWDVTGYATTIDPGEEFARFVMTLEIGRRVGFYWWKILLPLVIIVCVAWSTFWMTRDVLAQRQRQSGTAILTVVAFQFVAAADLPRVAYLTLMDMMILWTYLCIGSTLATNIISKRRFRLDEQRGLRADRVGRRYYFAVYLFGVLAIFLLQAAI